MGFSKKQAPQNAGSVVSSDEWAAWNELQWSALDVPSSVNSSGKEIKEMDVIGTVKFIMELGNLPQDDASMESKEAKPVEGEEHSKEELAKLEKFPNNYYKWVKEWDNNSQGFKEVRRIFWAQKPQEALVIAVDFQSLAIDYGKHPAVDGDAEDIRPLRIDYNGKFKESFERNIINEVNWKTGLFTPKDIKYQITTAIGNTAEYQADSHDLAYLVDATCNWRVVMTKNVNDGKTYYNTKIKTPTAIQDVKTRKDNYTVAEQIEDNICTSEFCGILFDGAAEDYTKADLQQIRPFWLAEAQKAEEFDKNKGTKREANGTWLEGMDYADSGLAKAIKKFGLDSTDKSPVKSGAKKVTPPAEKKVVAKEEVKTEIVEPSIDFDDDIPF